MGDYPYIVDDIDRKALELYKRRGFNPPTRPNGFLDDHEKAMWERWRDYAKENLNG